MTPNKNLSSSRMTRSLLVLVFAFCGLTATNTTLAQDIRDNFLVDKIYDYHNKLLAEYFYDNNNKLTKRIVADQIVEPSRTIDRKWESEFEYENGRVTKIKTYNLYIQKHNTIDALSYTQESNSETSFEYDLQGRPLKTGFLYEDGLLVSTYGYTLGPCFYQDTLKYDNSKNVTEHIYVGPEYNMIEQPILGTYRVSTRYYEYDDNPKPNFGLDYLFIFNPLPYSEVPDFTRALSKNNMTKATEDGYAFAYTYNENGLPKTIETKWLGIETLYPMLLRITYKQIEETNRDTYVGKIIEKGNPCPFSEFGECPPCIVLWLETPSKDYVLSINSNWICNDRIIVNEVEYLVGDKVEITGKVINGIDIHSEEYITLEVETIKKSTSSNIETSYLDNEPVKIVGYYNVLGAKLPKVPEKGIYIILYSNGKAEKMMR